MKKCSICGELYPDNIEECDVCGSTDFISEQPKRRAQERPSVSGNKGTQMSKPRPVNKSQGQKPSRPSKIQVEPEDDYNTDYEFEDGFNEFDDGTGENSDDMNFGEFEDSDFTDTSYEEEPPKPQRPIQRQPQRQPQRQGQPQGQNRVPQSQRPRQQRQQGQVQPRPSQNRQSQGGQTPQQNNNQTPENQKPQKKKQRKPSSDGSSILNWVFTFIFLIIPLINLGYIVRVLKDQNAPDYKKNYVKAFIVYFLVMGMLSAVIAITLGDKIIALLN